MDLSTRSFIIPAVNQKLVIEQIEKLNKRAIKLGFMDLLSLTWRKAFTDDNGNLLIPCDLSGPLEIRFEGWTFVATLQHLPTGENILRAISDDLEIPSEYRSIGTTCEHCHVNRYRKDTYLLHHAPAIFKAVGSSCIRDFLGGHSPDNILQKAAFVGELISFMHGATFITGSPNEGVYQIVNFLAHTAAIINAFGWVSKTKAYETGAIATATRVQDNLIEPKISISDADRKLAQAAADWAENLSDQETEHSDYLHNIRAIARSGMVGYRTVGFAASILTAYQRYLRGMRH